MSVQLITKEEAMSFLNYEEYPPYLIEFIERASAAVIRYLDGGATFINSDGDLDPAAIPEEAKQAVLILVRQMDMDREGAGEKIEMIDSKFGYGYLPAAVVRLLFPLRTPVIA